MNEKSNLSTIYIMHVLKDGKKWCLTSHLCVTFLKRYFSGELVSPFLVNLEQYKRSTYSINLNTSNYRGFFQKIYF